ncbi:MAG: oxidoreductase [Chloroflexota bacterium]|nr:oxidoreductase [Chloroflexota bacterium]
MNMRNQPGAVGRTVLVTGASAGIGKATVEKLLGEGYAVYAAARRVEQMRDLEEQGAVVLGMDVTREEDLVAAVDRIAAERGGVDVLVNNAGFGLFGPVEDITLDEARYQFEVNLFGLARLTQLVLPYMREQGAGRIVNVSSVAGKMYTPLGAWYHATKHALEGWSDCLRWELKPFGIDVVIIEPGLISTEFGDVAFGPVAKRSDNSAYAGIVNSMAERMNRSVATGSPPAVIANTIFKAIRVRRPRTLYVAGKYARLALLTRSLVTDRMFDWFVDRMAK